MLKIYNTLTKKVDEFTPLTDDGARIYSCGPTVYSYAHIGNLSSFIYADILRRVVSLSTAKSVQHVMNFTDVDDKTIRDSRIKYSDLEPLAALNSLTKEYEEIFQAEMREIGNDVEAIDFVRATENIEKIKALIKKLVKQKIAYKADDGIYFSIEKYVKGGRKYGQLSKISVGKSRVEADEYDKDQANDFALWKKQKTDEPAWDFKLGKDDFKGRPGWHIECSAMSVGELGQPFDIHTGGVDLIFPHHENEIAQSTAGDQPEQYAKFFVHNEHLLVEGAKMSKSKGNFYKLSDIKERGYHPLVFRLLVLQGHYRSAVNFSWDNMEAAKNRLWKWKNVLELKWQTTDFDDQGKQLDAVNDLVNKAIEALFNDLNTPEALKYIDQAFDVFSDPSKINHTALLGLVVAVSRIFGLSIVALTDDITDAQKDKIAERLTAREEKHWGLSDELRDELSDQGIELLDNQHSTIWHKL
jgi:cysteinyl-tRNA synthetase